MQGPSIRQWTRRGISQLFVRGLSAWCEQHLGVRFQFNTDVEGLTIEGDRVRSVRTSQGDFSCDAVVLSLGPESGLLGRKLGIDLPVYPVKGYTANDTTHRRKQRPDDGRRR